MVLYYIAFVTILVFYIAAAQNEYYVKSVIESFTNIYFKKALVSILILIMSLLQPRS
jgi:hypothetical protein